MAQAIWPEARILPALSVPDSVRRDWEREEAIAQVVHGRLECVGPVSALELGRALGLEPREVFRALVMLELQGVVLRGRFTPQAARAEPANELALEWCERRLLARIHRLTLEGLRRQIEPVPPEQFLRFLIRHQHVHSQTRLCTQAGLLEVIEQLQGFEAPAGDWEKRLLPARLQAYDPAWLDLLTLTGQVVWSRLRPSRRQEDRARPMKFLTRNTPLTLFLRRDLPWLWRDDSVRDGLAGLGGNAQAALEALSKHGALFTDQLAGLLQLVTAQVEDALGELVAAGLVTCDGFASLRRLIAGADVKGRQLRLRRGKPRPILTPVGGGRWCLIGSLAVGEVDAAARTENWCRLLLRRFGVMFRDLLAREAAAPPWHELLRTFRGMEARGEIRGGRFVAQVAGEQYALPETVSRLRQIEEADGQLLVLPATDPLSLFGRITAEPKVPASPGNRLVIEQGRLLAYRIGTAVHFVTPALAPQSRAAIEALLRRRDGTFISSQMASANP